MFKFVLYLSHTFSNMNKQNLYLFCGFALIFIGRMFENPYVMGGMALLGAISIIISVTYKWNKK